ncbi:THUMP-like domain-containing protein [Mycobacteroides chelonae]|uniref:Class I SAM-dependent methyltransferase n=1 Tax=Mycobacteroides chelonae TaxID=1774 RepID=A0AB73U4A8_MYCCH|nr:class I SAM-dependent methyltransferase [Mycobacteroides chelonae]OLT73323.1 SAM-dependent methyltransferase [Mycobacteroides chelonae]QDF71691.1 class I SAM-dependent methyltransferase [Mycobacteroides chelonae]WED92222.1 class I SAM-dependent methyltransferase [Mycobacteroides chelonae]WED95558.1 class I SAM-dependent methyltransferase [Mycobacteroides chelonae]
MFEPSDVAYLSSEAGSTDLARASAYTFSAGTLVADTAALRTEFGDRAAVLAQTVQLRRKAAAKLGDVQDWLFTDDALQQATPAAVARHRAERLADRVVHDVTCSVGAELAALDGVAATVIGSDIDPVRTAMARHNIGRRVLICQADALAPSSRADVVIADPGRRSGGRRRFDPSAYSPPLDLVLRTYADRDLVVKCAPGLDFTDLREQTGFGGEIEVVSLDGGVREACLWSAGLARARRRATVLSTAGDGFQLTDADPDDCALAEAGEWIIDPDGAVVRAGLVRQYAARHGLWQLDPRIAYLSGDSVPAGVQGYRVLDALAYSEKRLRQALAARDCGSVEITVRGVDVDPAVLRTRMKLRGGVALSVVITRIGSDARAFVCAARSPGGTRTPGPRSA